MVNFLKSGKASVCQPTQTLEKMCKGKKKGKNKGKEKFGFIFFIFFSLADMNITICISFTKEDN